MQKILWVLHQEFPVYDSHRLGVTRCPRHFGENWELCCRIDFSVHCFQQYDEDSRWLKGPKKGLLDSWSLPAHRAKSSSKTDDLPSNMTRCLSEPMRRSVRGRQGSLLYSFEFTFECRRVSLLNALAMILFFAKAGWSQIWTSKIRFSRVHRLQLIKEFDLREKLLAMAFKKWAS